MKQRATPRKTKITERDLELLEAAAVYRCISVSQIERLFFPSRQTATRRLRFLDRYGLLAVDHIPGLSDRVVRIRAKGLRLLGEIDQSTSYGSPKSRPRDHYFVRHLLALNDFRLNLEGLCRNHGEVELKGFIPEYQGEQSPSGLVRKTARAEVSVNGTRIGHTPDGVFSLSYRDKPALFFLEIDRGTEVIGHPDRGVGKICRFYLAYLLQAKLTRYQELFDLESRPKGFRLLFVTSSSTRLENIRSASLRIETREPKLRRFIWLAVQDSLPDNFLTSRCWVSLDPADTNQYSILPTKGATNGNHD